LEFGEDCGAIILVNPWLDVGGCHDGSYPILITDPTHLDGFFNGLGPIVYSKEDVAVEIDHLNGSPQQVYPVRKHQPLIGGGVKALSFLTGFTGADNQGKVF
jgi:hypothetical protein